MKKVRLIELAELDPCEDCGKNCYRMKDRDDCGLPHLCEACMKIASQGLRSMTDRKEIRRMVNEQHS